MWKGPVWLIESEVCSLRVKSQWEKSASRWLFSTYNNRVIRFKSITCSYVPYSYLPHIYMFYLKLSPWWKFVNSLKAKYFPWAYLLSNLSWNWLSEIEICPEFSSDNQRLNGSQLLTCVGCVHFRRASHRNLSKIGKYVFCLFFYYWETQHINCLCMPKMLKLSHKTFYGVM